MSSKKIGVGAALSTSIWASCAFAEITPFERGQLWECTVRHETASPDERLQFLITGIATEREVSRRPNFQNDKPVISVALTDLDPLACSQAKRFLHMAYSERALRACAPTLVEKDNRLAASNGWRAARNARGRWLIEMQSNKGVIIDLNPSRFLSLLKRKRCQTPQTDGE